MLVALLALLALVFLLCLFTYNGFVRSRARTREAWSGIDVQLRRRADLVPNLVATVRGYAAYEGPLLEDVARARGALQQAGGARAAGEADRRLGEAVTRLLAVVEAYPELRASASFLGLQRELSDIEEKVAFARQFYNLNVLDYNTRIETFPRLLLARAFSLRPAEFFQAPDEVKAVSGVRFGSERSG